MVKNLAMENLKDKASYGVGMSVANSLLSQDLEDLNLELFTEAMKDVFAKKATKFSPQEANATIQEYLDSQASSKYEIHKKDGTEFLSVNAKKENIVSLSSGLQYEIVTEGSGAKPNATAQVTVHYHGTLIDGTVFDSSVERGSPATFGVNQVIKGWTEALQLMPVGSKWKLYIPQELAYGANPHPGGPIKPFMALIFDVELLEIN